MRKWAEISDIDDQNKVIKNHRDHSYKEYIPIEQPDKMTNVNFLNYSELNYIFRTIKPIKM